MARRGSPPAKIRKGGGAAPLKTAKEPGEKHRLEPYFNFLGRIFFNHMNRKIILVILLIVIAISAIGYFSFFKNSTPYASQKECEQKTGKQCFLFKGLCQVGEAQNPSEAEAN